MNGTAPPQNKRSPAHRSLAAIRSLLNCVKLISPRIYAFWAFFPSTSLGSSGGNQPNLAPGPQGNSPLYHPVWRSCNTVNKLAMDKKCAQVWERLSAALKPQISADSFKRWFSAVELVQANDKSLTFRVPNNIYQFWIESNYMTALQSRRHHLTWRAARRKVFLSLRICGANAFGGCRHLKGDFARVTRRHKNRREPARAQSTKHVSNLLWSARTTRLRMPPVSLSRSRRRALTIHSLFTAASASAKRI